MNSPRTCSACAAPIDGDARFCKSCGAATPSLPTGAILDGKYEILEKIGQGGMGEVFRVRHLHLDEHRLVKIVRRDRGPDMRERFAQEARLAAQVRHPNVAALFDFAPLPGGGDYMVWELIEGETLQLRLARVGSIPPVQTVRLALGMLAGLDAIHQAGVVHRDISPDNIMLTRRKDGSETAKIIDLGIARPVDPEAPKITSTGMFVGKLRYASPEQVGMLDRGESLDARSDLYSLSLVLYEMLVGAEAYDVSSPQGYLVAHVRQDPKPLSSHALGATLPRGLEAVIAKGLAKDRRERWSSAGEFASALSAFAPGGGTTVQRPHLPSTTLPPRPAAEALATVVTASPEAETLDGSSTGRRMAATRIESAPSRSRPVVALVSAGVVLGGSLVGAWLYWFGNAEPKPAPPPAVDRPRVVPPPAPPAVEPKHRQPEVAPPPSAAESVASEAAPAESAAPLPESVTVAAEPVVAPPGPAWSEVFPSLASEAAATAKYEVVMQTLAAPTKEDREVGRFVDFCNRVVGVFPTSTLAARMREEVPALFRRRADSAYEIGVALPALHFYDAYAKLAFAAPDPAVVTRRQELREAIEKRRPLRRPLRPGR